MGLPQAHSLSLGICLVGGICPMFGGWQEVSKKRDEGPGALLTRKMEVSSSPVLFRIPLLYRNTAHSPLSGSLTPDGTWHGDQRPHLQGFSLLEPRGSLLETALLPRGHLAISGDIFLKIPLF